MYKTSLMFALVAILATAGAWQVGYLKNVSFQDKTVDLTDLDRSLSEPPKQKSKEVLRSGGTLTPPQKNLTDKTSEQLNLALGAAQWPQAMAIIDDVYSQANTQQLNHFKSLVFKKANELRSNNKQSSADLLFEYTRAFDDIDAWRQLASLSAELGNWDIAVTALLASSSQEYEPQAYEESLRALLRAASHVRATLEQRNDQLSILGLYQRIYDLHPNHTRFQLELAQAHFRLNDYETARPYLEALAYDTKLGPIAQQILASIDSSLAKQQKVPSPIKPERRSDSRISDIRIPLVRSGNSLLIDVSINSSSLRLLLDTGASITALSSDAIRQLGLKPTGRTISLSTANGLTQSQLYKADRLSLGSLRLKNVVVAEVDLGRPGQVAGLLGTDMLKRVNSQFSYLIDDHQNALIFREK